MTDQALARKESFWQRNYFLLRRLHSVTGLFPVGLYLCVHLATNSSVLDTKFRPGEMFQSNVDKIHSMGSMLIFVETFFIFLPILFHAGLGLLIWWTGSVNVVAYPHGANVRYTLQRITAGLTLAFLIFHVGTLWVGYWTPFDAHHAHATTVRALQAAWWVPAVYFIGITSAVFHFANGLWTGLITWGWTVGPNAQRASGIICAAIGLVLGAIGLGALFGFSTADIVVSVAAP